MFGTVILDAYTKEETEELASAINDLCCPTDSYGWASAGVYSFWDYNTHELLYIGLASDLYERFRQHNGFTPVSDECCKYQQIQDYFESHEKLGYTIFVQSPLSQPLVHRNKDMYEKIAKELNSTVQNMMDKQGINDIKRVEGILIEAYRKYMGRYPAWNKMGGSVEGQKRVMDNNINIVKSFSNPQMYDVSPIMSRSTIRELSNNPTYESFESFLHAVRMFVLILGVDFEQALNIQNQFDTYGWYKRICEEKYLEKKLVL